MPERTTLAIAALVRPLIDELSADHVSIQVTAADPEATLIALGADVLPALRG